MIEVKQGDYVVGQNGGYYFMVRADEVTPKQIRTRGHGRRLMIQKRDDVLFVGSREQASYFQLAVEAAKDQRRAARNAAVREFDRAVAPFVEIRDAAIEAAMKAERDAVLEIIEAAAKGVSA